MTTSSTTHQRTQKGSSHKRSSKSKSLASNKVERAMHEMKRGELRSGGSGKKVTSRKQAIAIGLSEARKKGAHIPKKSSRSHAN